MRVAFSRNRVVTPDWQGNKSLPEEQQIKFAYKPLSYGDFTDAAELMGSMAKKRGLKEGDEVKIEVDVDSAEGKELIKLYARLLPAHVTSVGAPLLPNVNDKDQAPVTMEEIATLQPFVMLATELLATLVVLSTPTEADIKN